MIIHLESRNCGSGSNKSFITKVARECYQNAQYMTPSGSIFCPHCKNPAATISGLFQHAGMRLECAPFFTPGGPNVLTKLLRYIKWQVGELAQS
jgi:hypothetical protein